MSDSQRSHEEVAMPTVSVVMPAFNAARYIGEALGSIRDQTLRDVEVILVDDGSSDDTLREARRFASSLDLIIVQQQNQGPSTARNNGIRRARGRYCAFLDADDVMLPELLATQAALLDADRDLGLVLTDVATFDEKGTIRAAHWNLAGLAGAGVLERLLLENFVTTSAVMAPTTRLIEAGLFSPDRRVGEDYELWLRLAVRWKVACLDRSLVRYRYAEGSLSSDKLYSARCALDVITTFWREHPDYLQNHADLRHRSLARHLRNAGAAAAVQRQRVRGLAYLFRALWHEPLASATWKSVVKTLVLPSEEIARRARRRPAEQLM
jgi:glycosyltransferase involved in cell wall biosynthesis